MNDGLHDRDHNTHECILVYTNMVLAPYARHLACLYSSLSCGPDNEIPNTSCQVFGAHCAESWPGCSLRHRSADVMLQYRYRTALWFVWHQRGDSKDKHRDITPSPQTKKNFEETWTNKGQIQQEARLPWSHAHKTSTNKKQVTQLTRLPWHRAQKTSTHRRQVQQGTTGLPWHRAQETQVIRGMLT